MVQNIHVFSGNIFFLTFGNAKNPTGLKPYWSRAGLRHPGFHWFCSTQARGLFTRHSWYVSTIANANALFLGNKAPLIPIELLCFSSALMCLVGMKGKTKGQPGSIFQVNTKDPKMTGYGLVCSTHSVFNCYTKKGFHVFATSWSTLVATPFMKGELRIFVPCVSWPPDVSMMWFQLGPEHIWLVVFYMWYCPFLTTSN